MVRIALFLTLLIGMCSSGAAQPSPPPSAPTGPLPVVLGSYEADYLYPWTVQIGGCRATLISPKWILTAAHCIFGPGTTAIMSRRNPAGQDMIQTRQSAPGGMMPFPAYASSAIPANDIALIRLAQSFDIVPGVQVAGLPIDARHTGIVGTVAGNSHTGTPPPGKLSVFRAPIAPWSQIQYFEIKSTTASGSLCPGDSGSGFVTVENGRATVRGVASEATVNQCTSAPDYLIDFADVQAHRDWILTTMRVTDYLLDGNTRLRASGYPARGTLQLACDTGAPQSISGPLYVRGVQLGLNCANDAQQAVVCAVDSGQSRLIIRKFTMTAQNEDGSTQVQSLPHSAHLAAFSGNRPHGAYRTFDCVVKDRYRVEVPDRAPPERAVQ